MDLFNHTVIFSSPKIFYFLNASFLKLKLTVLQAADLF